VRASVRNVDSFVSFPLFSAAVEFYGIRGGTWNAHELLVFLESCGSCILLPA